ncbi:unnamed protein product (macronuclear) [Paramecium tetraurelia]|uniref:Uncharacterized protein n=1 Tax=Paramecium tetraurelia TaxID=5888 RepID=A0C154_PARTE|nr:uncharacterized protein GSPATT00033997001 [Paramecium tetraurelia]CAK64521.1 unnamed protein product [Paramecium tetraurelia]|eukprot:XP_001431919.1 hypothetical protein (macronuclear) [Paramecium tetraurelia strain d4-2]
MSEKNSISIKLVALGDGGVGKHDILLSYLKDHLTQDFVPQVFENYTIQTAFEGKTVNLSLWDTAGQETYNRLRLMSFQSSSQLLIKKASKNAINKWYQEVETPELKQVPKIFVGNNKDMRNVANPNHVQYEAAKSNINQLQCQYLECSTQTQEGVKEIFDLAIRNVALGKGVNSQNASSKKSDGKEKCLIF